MLLESLYFSIFVPRIDIHFGKLILNTSSSSFWPHLPFHRYRRSAISGVCLHCSEQMEVWMPETGPVDRVEHNCPPHFCNSLRYCKQGVGQCIIILFLDCTMIFLGSFFYGLLDEGWWSDAMYWLLFMVEPRSRISSMQNFRFLLLQQSLFFHFEVCLPR